MHQERKINWPKEAKPTNITKVTHGEVLHRYRKLHKSKKKVYFTMGAPEVKPEELASWSKEHCVYDLHHYLSGGRYPLLNFYKPGNFHQLNLANQSD